MKYLLDGEETERLTFRKIQGSDFDTWLKFFRDPRSHTHWKSLKDTPEAECRKWYDKQQWRYDNNMGGMNAMIEKQTGILVGHCGLFVQTVDKVTELEIGYSFLPTYWKNGFAIESARKCRDYGFANNFSTTLISIISITNKPSEAVALKNGMSLEKTTMYNDNKVNIFRISHNHWKRIKSEVN